MKLLFLTPYLPAPPNFGGASRMYHLIREVRRRHEVVTLSLAAPGDDPTASETALGRVVPVLVPNTARMPPSRRKRLTQIQSLASRHSFQRHFYHAPAVHWSRDRLIAEGVDVVQIEFSQMGVYAPPDGVPTVLDVHNIEHDLLRQIAQEGSPARRMFNLLEYRKFRREEAAAWRAATTCIATSTTDAAVIERVRGDAVPVIPNGVDLATFPRTPLTGTDPAALIFVGAMRYRPNAEAARLFVEWVLPSLRAVLPRAQCTIAGADPPVEVQALAGQPGVQVTGTVPDIRPWVQAAGTVVVPLQSGGGTRLKILEAFAMGRPVVSTTVGAQGLDVRDGEHLLIADTPEAFVQAIQRLAREPGLRAHLVEQAYGLVRDQYQWSAIAERLDDLYQHLIATTCRP